MRPRARTARRPRSSPPTLAHYGRVDVLVNNAGTSEPTPALDETTDKFAATLRVNLVAPFELARECARAMIAVERGGTIVNVASIWGLVGVGQIPEAGYAASKGGLINLTRELAAQWARKGVRVNCLAPGWFRTEMTDGLMFGDERAERWMRQRTPMGRGGDERRARRRAALPRERREQLHDRPGRSASTAAGPASEPNCAGTRTSGLDGGLLEDVDGAGGAEADHVREADLGALDLAVAGLAAQVRRRPRTRWRCRSRRSGGPSRSDRPTRSPGSCRRATGRARR